MLHGMGAELRQVMLYAKPWQRYLISGVIIAAGIVMITFGDLRGVLFVGIGGLLFWRMVPARFRMKRTTGHVDDEGRP